jgi:NAD-dependent oxidoreductase involved in siderophore biosynthesis
MNQVALFHDTIYDAIGADIAAVGGFKVVAGKLWPAESPSLAAAKLRNAINPDQPHKLCPDEVLQIKRLAKEVGSFATVQYEASQLGYEITWIAPEDELERIERENNELLKAIFRRQERAEQLRSQTKLKVATR